MSNYIIYPIITLCIHHCRILIIPQNNTFVDFEFLSIVAPAITYREYI